MSDLYFAAATKPLEEFACNKNKSSDYISRRAALDEIKDMYIAAEKWAYQAKDEETKARAESCMATNIEMKLRIEKLPAAQPERKKGKWTIDDCHGSCYPYRCSNCTAHHRARYDYCPSCGAEMDNHRNEENKWVSEIHDRLMGETGGKAVCKNEHWGRGDDNEIN